MPLTPTTRLGPYEILAPLGAGGMGEVYRARDTRLGRDVAIKALPAAFSQDPDRLARFEREARLLASLAHPNIAGIFGLEEVGNDRYLVLELVEGESLAAHTARGPLPVREAIEIGRQIAAGVEAAHESGVVHRDLKPANIMLTPAGGVKVLDFGLAKASSAGSTGASGHLSASPTITTAGGTSAGVVLGTAAYMSPEQARGRAVDRRTDVWSFGCVLYECLTGCQAFEGETVSDLIAKILEREPDWSALPAATPPRVVELLHRCLTKEAALRLRDIGEARITLAHPVGHASSPPATKDGRARWLAPAVAAVLAAVATAAVLVATRPPRPSAPVRRFALPVSGLPARMFSPLALARDGSAIAYAADGRVWIRRFDQAQPVEIPGSSGGRNPFWSWDRKSVAFEANRKLVTFAVGSDQSRIVCDLPESGSTVGGAWGPDGRIVFAAWRGGLYQVTASGGDARLLLGIDSSTVDFHGPSFLPDGRTLLVLVHDRKDRSAVALVVGSPPRLERVFVDDMANSVAYSPTGHLLLTRASSTYSMDVRAVPFSAERHRVTGAEFRVLDAAGCASASAGGLLVAVENAAPANGRLEWRSKDGGAIPIGEPLPNLNSLSISPDGRHVAFAAIRNDNSEVWVQDLVRGTRSLLVSGRDWVGEPVWSRDGRRLFYTSFQDIGSERIVAVASDGGGVPDTIADGVQATPAPDGSSIVYTLDRKGNADLWTVRLDRKEAPRPFLATDSNEMDPAFSPDGRWIAYTSSQSGNLEVYLVRYPEGDDRRQVSVGGGGWPRWTPRGDAICYLQGDSLRSVSVGPGPSPALGRPRLLFTAGPEESSPSPRPMENAPFDVHPDGARIIDIQSSAAMTTRNVLVIENWLGSLPGR